MEWLFQSTSAGIVEMLQMYNSSDSPVSFLQCEIKRNATTGLYLTVLLLLGNPQAPLEFLFFLRSTPLATFFFNWRQLTYERKTISALNTLFAVCHGRTAHRLASLVALLWYKNRVNISFEPLSAFNWRTLPLTAHHICKSCRCKRSYCWTMGLFSHSNFVGLQWMFRAFFCSVDCHVIKIGHSMTKLIDFCLCYTILL